MSKTLIVILLKLCQQPGPDFEYKSGVALAQFCGQYGLGMHSQRKSILFSPSEIEKIRSILKSAHGVDWNTSPGAWDGLSRSEALAIGSNEKLTSIAVRADRVAIKTLPGRPLLLNGSQISLPNGTNLDIPWPMLAEQNGHEKVLVIENWECFEKVEQIPLLRDTPGNPLVVYRGDMAYSQKHTHALLKALALPVMAFVDLDPAGLIIAQAFPFFRSIVRPDAQALAKLFAACQNDERFIMQAASRAKALEELGDPALRELCSEIQAHGVALPQEIFIGRDVGKGLGLGI